MSAREMAELIRGHEAEGIVAALIGDLEPLLEDRIDDLLARYNPPEPEEGQPAAAAAGPRRPKLDRRIVQTWFQYDPTPNHKYIPWIIKEVAEGRMKLPQDGHELRDNLMTFERLLAIPAYQGQRDLYQIDWEGLRGVVHEHGAMQSKSKQEREKKEAGAQVVGRAGNLVCLRITTVPALTSWSWKAYSADNPNWKKTPVVPREGLNDPFQDHLWCTRFPTYATSYLQSGPFNMVLKDGGPYVGLVFTKGEAQTLENHGISTAVAEEIFPVVKDEIPADAVLSRNAKVFSNIRFLHGEVKPGETVQGPVDLAGTTLAQLPSNLTVNGSLDISNTPIALLPAGLSVAGTLKINGTQIKDLPLDLKVEDMEWSPPLNWNKVKALFYRVRHMDMKDHFMQHPKLANATPEKKEKEWVKFQPALLKYFQTNPDVDKNVRSVYRLVPGAEGAVTEPEE